MNTESTSTCACNVCSQRIEFESFHAGETIQCPSCACETVLYIPPVPKPKKISTAKLPVVATNQVSAVEVVRESPVRFRERDERMGRIVNKGSLLGAGCLLQVLAIIVFIVSFLNPIGWIIAGCLFLAGMVQARKPCCADCGTRLNFRSVRICPGCGTRFR